MKSIFNIITCWILPALFLLPLIISYETINTEGRTTIVVIDTTSYTQFATKNIGHNIALIENANWTYDLSVKAAKGYDNLITVRHGGDLEGYLDYVPAENILALQCRKDDLYKIKGTDPKRALNGGEMFLTYLWKNQWLADLSFIVWGVVTLWGLGVGLIRSTFIITIPSIVLIIISYII